MSPAKLILMNLSQAERGMLATKMADDVIASIFGRKVGWVRKARAAMAQEIAADVARWERLGSKAASGQGEPVGAGSQAESQPLPQPPAPAPAAARAEPDEPRSDQPSALQRADADANGKPKGAPAIADRPGAAAPTPAVTVAWPADLTGRALAAWLYDNSSMTFEQIAQTAAVPLPMVQWIADGQPEPLKAGKPKPASVPKALPMPGYAFQPVDNGGGRAFNAPEIPPRVIRWARWFVEARWRMAEVASLFEVPEGALRAALAPTRKAGQAA